MRLARSGMMCIILHMSQITDSLAEIGRKLRERRVAAGLSQAEAAALARVGRSTLIHLEGGKKDSRLSNVLSVAHSVGASLELRGGPQEHLERLRLRADEASRLARRRQAHLKLALDLALDRPDALRALDDARAMVSLWKRDRTCSEHYIVEWSRILKGNPVQVARRIRDIDEPWLDALLQNTPFSRALSVP